jgi:hypothetical protein
MSSFFHVACWRKGEETITARTSFSSFIVSRHLDISYSRGRVSLCSTSLVHPSRCSCTRHILRSVLFLVSVFRGSIIYIILGYTTLLVWPLRTYSDRESSFFAGGEWCGWWFWGGWCGCGGFGLGNTCIVLTLSGAMFCVGHCWYRDNTFLSPNLRSLCSIEFPRQVDHII